MLNPTFGLRDNLNSEFVLLATIQAEWRGPVVAEQRALNEGPPQWSAVLFFAMTPAFTYILLSIYEILLTDLSTYRPVLVMH